MDPNVISLAARALRTRLAVALSIPEGNIFIGHPASAAEKAQGQQDKQFLNVFVYELEHSGYPADGLASDPTYLRLHVLITPFGNDDAGNAPGKASAGENDLKLVGAVVAALHERPAMVLESGNERIQLQIVPQPFSVESVNNLWATQLNASYRASVAYELALAPVPFRVAQERGPRVGTRDVAVQPFPASNNEGELGDDGSSLEIRFVDAQGGLAVAMAVAGAAVPPKVSVTLAGPPGQTVALRWELWDRPSGWRVASESSAVEIATSVLDPAAKVDLALPLAPNSTPRQYLLVASGLLPAPGAQSREARSNRLLISVFGGSS
jgi:Pvc16 N-terminal domain